VNPETVVLVGCTEAVLVAFPAFLGGGEEVLIPERCIFPTRVGTPEKNDNVLERFLKPLANEIGGLTFDFPKLRRSRSTSYAVLNVHPAWRR
jgi:hypothetical protein